MTSSQAGAGPLFQVYMPLLVFFQSIIGIYRTVFSKSGPKVNHQILEINVIEVLHARATASSKHTSFRNSCRTGRSLDLDGSKESPHSFEHFNGQIGSLATPVTLALSSTARSDVFVQIYRGRVILNGSTTRYYVVLPHKSMVCLNK